MQSEKWVTTEVIVRSGGVLLTSGDSLPQHIRDPDFQGSAVGHEKPRSRISR